MDDYEGDVRYIARYHAEQDAVVVQFVSTTGGDVELVTNVVYN